LPQILSSRRPRPGKIAERFVFNSGHVHSRQIAGAQGTRKLNGIAPVCLDALAGLPWDQRWGTDCCAFEAALNQPG